MEFRETLLAAQRNQQQKSSESSYYKARFDPPKKEQRQKDRLSANIQKFLAKKEEEERQKKLEAQRKREELLAMRDPKALRKIQKTLKVIKSANKSVIADAVDRDNTAITRAGPDQPDQDDYGYESQEAAALYEKMMQKYSKLPEEPKFPAPSKSVKKDLNGTIERVKHALQHEDEPVPHKRKRKSENSGHGERDISPPKYEPEKKKDEKSDKPKFRKPAPPPMDFNQLLKLAEQKKSEPIEVVAKKVIAESEPERLMTKKQKREYEEEVARRQRRQERMENEKGVKKVNKEDGQEKERKQEPSGFNRIPKLNDRQNNNQRNEGPKTVDKEKYNIERERSEKMIREKEKARLDKEKAVQEKERQDRERLDKLKAERERIEKDIERLNKERERLDKTKSKLESSRPIEKVNKSVDRPKSNSGDQNIKKNIDFKSQNTYRIDKNSNEKKIVIPNKNTESKYLNGHSSQRKSVPKPNKDSEGLQKSNVKDKIVSAKQKALFGDDSLRINGTNKLQNGKIVPESSKGTLAKRPDDKRPPQGNKPQQFVNKPKIENSFDFDKHVSSLSKNVDKNGMKKSDGSRQFPPGDVKRKVHPDDPRRKQKRRVVDSESEYDSEMDDFIDDGDENIDYSKHIKEIFGYDKSRYRHMDDEDDPEMESSFARQQREEYISKKIGIMEDLEDMRMEAMEKKKAKKKRRLSDD